MSEKTYSIHDKWTDIDKLNNVDIKSVDGVIESVKINGEEAGGGGSSDFSTAEVTVINASTEYANTLKAPIVIDSDSESVTLYEMDIRVGQTITANVIMYKGNALAYITDVETVSGAIKSIGDDRYLITGECTITIS